MKLVKWPAMNIPVCCLMLLLAPAKAAVVNFDSVPNAGITLTTPIITDGFRFASGHYHIIKVPSAAGFGGAVDNGTQYIAEEAGSLGLPITMTEMNGNPFSLIRFDAAEVFLNNSAATTGGFPNAARINLVGTRIGGGSLNTSFTLDGLHDGAGGINDFQTFVLPTTWTDLLTITFSGSTVSGGPGGISFDNLQVAAVPEPASSMLIALVTGLGIAVRLLRKDRE